jgi:hypothetical protein
MKQVGLVSSRITDRREFRDHLRRLKRAKIVNPLLARIMQKHYEAAFRDYFTLELPVTQIGRKHGIANLASVMQRYREKGFTFPPPLFKYGENTRRARPREWTNKKERAKVK